MKYDNILDAVGQTPLIRLNRINQGLKPTIYAKVEYLNPGGSIKDRIAINMINQAEARGDLKPGGTIIEGTSGNTGMGLALLAAVRGYKVIFTTTDKQSKEKVDLLKALGAEVIVCPTAVEPDDPRSYYSVAKKLASEIPNSYYPNQYDNADNPQTHMMSTGPEIWEATEGKITHFVAGMGTGGTISGTGRYLKNQNPNVKVVGVDPVGSLYHEYFHQQTVGKPHTYVVEGIGEDIFPSTMHFDVLDDCLQVTDRDCFLFARRLARQEGIFSGGSAGAAIWAALQVAKGLTEEDVMVVLIPDTGRQYMSKVYDDAWMRDNQYLGPSIKVSAGECLRIKSRFKDLHVVHPEDNAQDVMAKMEELDISQMPVFEDGRPMGSVTEDKLVTLVLQGYDLGNTCVRDVMESSFPIVTPETPIDQINGLLRGDAAAVFVQMSDGRFEIITKYDVVRTISEKTETTPEPGRARVPSPAFLTGIPPITGPSTHA
ncbi:MAG: pyridoxal-phosphate dependent enzyme [Mariniblastus sp.]|nr:pyridoxal-phosphate dependent enzyme [Mariniblastus sp.]